MAAGKTGPGPGVEAFIDAIADPVKQADSRRLIAIMSRLTDEPPVLWGGSMIGFGRYAYRYESGHSGESFRVGFAPRKANLTLYLMPGYDDLEDELAKLGKHTTGKACLYVKRLGDVDLDVLERLIARSVRTMKERYPEDG